MPFFSVIIPTFNRYDLTRRAVQSVLDQTFTDYEVIVVDDGSTDDTPLLRDEYHGRITYLRQENLGVSAARNKGIGLASAPFVAFLDSDDFWLPEKLDEQHRYSLTHPGILLHQCEETWIRRGRRVNPGFRHLKREGYIFIDSLDLCLISPSASVLHRSLFETYGKFDENLPACEDYDLWLRITSREQAGLIQKELMVRHGGHEDQLSVKYWGMDRFRIYSILKLICGEGDSIREEYRRAAAAKAMEKLSILSSGCVKRRKNEDAQLLTDIIKKISNEDYSSIDYQILLQL